MENASAQDSAGCPAGRVMKVLSVVTTRVGVQRYVGAVRTTPESFQVFSTVVVAFFGFLGCLACTLPRSIEGGGRRSSPMIAARLERGRDLPSPNRVGSGCSQYSEIRMLVTP
eukprot:8102264-Pyramimonas_sp.AAC.1